MELANRAAQNPTADPVRVAVKSDGPMIMSFLNRAVRVHVHVDWHLPVDWLGTPGFVLHQNTPPANATFAAKLLGHTDPIEACLAVAADPLPAAWVRVAALRRLTDPVTLLGGMLAKVVEYLRQLNVSTLAWLLPEPWPEWWLSDLGFRRINHIETHFKDGLDVPDVRSIQGLTIQPAQIADIEELAEIERMAFDPLWRHSAQSLILARRQTIGFDVARLDGRVAGFQLSAQSDTAAHLVRLTIHPDLQRQGIGSALLDHAFRKYRQLRLQGVSLNTQADNIPSQRLYQRFGFNKTGHLLPVWAMDLP